MSDAPERIWLDWPAANKGDPVYDEPPERDTQPGQTEYVRADRIAALEAERDDYREKWVRDTGKLAVYAEQQEDRADRLEAEVARLREALGGAG